MKNERKPWRWMKSEGGWDIASDRGPNGRRFHAYDVNAHAACEPSIQLGASCEEPNEGSDFCPLCVRITQEHPLGREPIDWSGFGKDNHTDERFKSRFVST